jgi:hypothetical protein
MPLVKNSNTEFQAQNTTEEVTLTHYPESTTAEHHLIEDVKNNLGPSMSAIGYSQQESIAQMNNFVNENDEQPYTLQE